MKLKIPEKQVMRAVFDYLVARKIFCWRNNSGALMVDKRFINFGAAGSPDIIAVHRGRFIGIECKGSNGRQTQQQKQFQQSIELSGGIYILAKSIDDVACGLADLGQNASKDQRNGA